MPLEHISCFACFYNPPLGGIIRNADTIAGGAALCWHHTYLVGLDLIRSNDVLNHPATVKDWEESDG